MKNTRARKLLSLLLIAVACEASAEEASSEKLITWISSVRSPGGRLQIARTISDGKTSEVTFLTDSPHNDYKPVVSPDGSKIAFFRSYREGQDFFLWDTSICVINADGSGFRELTDHTFMNTEPYWARDGSNRITWSRMIHASEGAFGTYVYQTKCTGEPGDERQISAGKFEWGNSSLKDGRVFVLKEHAYHLMTSSLGGTPTYKRIRYPGPFHYLHKVTISNDETKIAYMKKTDPKGDDYRGSEIVFADLDTSVPAISNEYTFVPRDPAKFSWYVSFSPMGDELIYAEDGKILLYDMNSRSTRQLSTRDDLEYRYPNFEGSVK